MSNRFIIVPAIIIIRIPSSSLKLSSILFPSPNVVALSFSFLSVCRIEKEVMSDLLLNNKEERKKWKYVGLDFIFFIYIVLFTRYG